MTCGFWNFKHCKEAVVEGRIKLIKINNHIKHIYKALITSKTAPGVQLSRQWNKWVNTISSHHHYFFGHCQTGPSTLLGQWLTIMRFRRQTTNGRTALLHKAPTLQQCLTTSNLITPWEQQTIKSSSSFFANTTAKPKRFRRRSSIILTVHSAAPVASRSKLLWELHQKIK